MSEPVGPLVDSLGVTHDPVEGELVSDVVVVMEIIGPDGTVTLRSLCSPGTSWIKQAGMLRVAEQIEMASLRDTGG